MPHRILKKIQQIKEESQKFILERKLRKKIGQLKNQLAHIARKDSKVKGDYKARFPFFGRGKDEDAQEVERYEYRLSLEHRIETDLQKIENALKKIKDGKYGICENCGKKINPERLKVYLEARHCMACHKRA